MATIAEQLVKLNDVKKDIKTAIEAKGVPVGDAPFAEYSGKIDAIEGGEKGLAKYGVSYDNTREVTAAGVLQIKQTKNIKFDINLTGIKKIGDNALNGLVTGCGGGTVTLYAPDLEEVGTSGLRGVMDNSVGRSVFLPKLKTVKNYGCYRACFGIKTQEVLDLSSVETVMHAGMQEFATNASDVTTVLLDSLVSAGNYSFAWAFARTGIKSISFPMLVTAEKDAFVLSSSGTNPIFDGCSALTEIHFREDFRETAETMYGYSTKWGATNATIYFDLPNISGVES